MQMEPYFTNNHAVPYIIINSLREVGVSLNSARIISWINILKDNIKIPVRKIARHQDPALLTPTNNTKTA